MFWEIARPALWKSHNHMHTFLCLVQDERVQKKHWDCNVPALEGTAGYAQLAVMKSALATESRTCTHRFFFFFFLFVFGKSRQKEKSLSRKSAEEGNRFPERALRGEVALSIVERWRVLLNNLLVPTEGVAQIVCITSIFGSSEQHTHRSCPSSQDKLNALTRHRPMFWAARVHSGFVSDDSFFLFSSRDYLYRKSQTTHLSFLPNSPRWAQRVTPRCSEPSEPPLFCSVSFLVTSLICFSLLFLFPYWKKRKTHQKP